MNEAILIAEDDAEVRLVTRNILEEFGYRVIEASDGEDAVRMFRQHRDEIHVVLLDLVMTKKTGVEAYKEIKALGDEVEVGLFLRAEDRVAGVVHQHIHR